MAKKSKSTQRNQSYWWIITPIIIIILLVAGLTVFQSAGSGAETATTVAQQALTITPVEEIEPAPTDTATPVAEPATHSSPLPTVVVQNSAPEKGDEPPIYDYEIVNIYPHDPGAFTQGLVYVDDILYEGTGLRGYSTIRKVDLETGEVSQISSIDAQFFGEGITVFGDKLYQLTWQSKQGFVYDKNTFALEHAFTYPTEGWGITHDGQSLIMSDGTPNLYFLDPETLTEVRRVVVMDRNNPISHLNELEYVNGQVYANVWKTDFIAIIDPQTGLVTGWINLTNILGPQDRIQRVDVLNGIAYDTERDRLFVTGKWWPKLFEITLKTAE